MSEDKHLLEREWETYSQQDISMWPACSWEEAYQCFFLTKETRTKQCSATGVLSL